MQQSVETYVAGLLQEGLSSTYVVRALSQVSHWGTRDSFLVLCVFCYCGTICPSQSSNTLTVIKGHTKTYLISK